MIRSILTGAAALVLLLATPGVRAADPPGTDEKAAEPPSVFADLTPANAGRRAAKENKLLIIKATAEWCGPCKRMDRTTFRDSHVVDWINKHAIAIQLDVDKMPRGAKALHVSAMPTIIVFKGKSELDRVVGYLDADGLLAFLEGVRSGTTHDQRIDTQLTDLKQKGQAGDMQARYRYAQSLLRDEQYEKATDEFEWLWNHILEHDRSFVGVRSSFMASDMERLAAAYPPALERFTKLRDALEPRVEPGDRFNDDALSDWIVLNDVVRDEQRTLDWIDRVAKRDDARRYLSRQPRIFDILIARGDWALAADALLPTPSLIGILRSTDFDRAPFNTAHFRAFTINSTADDYAALLAAGRTEDARALAEALFATLDDSDATKDALAGRAAVAGVPESGRRAWDTKPSPKTP